MFPTRRMKHHDPFVLLDEFFVTPPAGFPPHGHKGFEAITYMIDGAFRHEDSLGNKSTVQAGGAQRFTAGRGIMHSEMPGSDKVSHGLQLWINLPRSMKQIPAEYQQVNPGEFPEEKKKGMTIRHVMGKGSPLTLKTNVIYQDIWFHQEKRHTVKFPGNYNGFVYCLEGALSVNEETIETGSAMVFTEQKEVSINATDKCRFVVIAGKPLYELIKQYGPFVE